jgi:nitrogen regulatory protein PII
MKMLMIICPQAREQELTSLVGEHGVHAFTEIRSVVGEGERGRHLGTSTWPGREVLLFTVVKDDQLEPLTTALRECAKSLYPDEGIRAFVLPVEQAV